LDVSFAFLHFISAFETDSFPLGFASFTTASNASLRFSCAIIPDWDSRLMAAISFRTCGTIWSWLSDAANQSPAHAAVDERINQLGIVGMVEPNALGLRESLLHAFHDACPLSVFDDWRIDKCLRKTGLDARNHIILLRCPSWPHRETCLPTVLEQLGAGNLARKSPGQKEQTRCLSRH
jgi:hypothetical protein